MLEHFGDKACYTYNSAGIRTEKCIKGVPTKYVVSGSTILSETTNNIATIYYHSVGGVVGFNRGGADYFYRKNIQGDIIAIVNASGTVVAKYVYDAWGNHKVFNSAGTVIYDSQNPTSTYANEIGHINPFRYRSYYFDNETGLYYLQSRYYDPQVGRFINADSIDYLEPKQLQGLNLYSYCQNNPVMYVDPTGHIVFSIIIGFLVGAIWGAVSAKLSGGDVFAGALIGGIFGAIAPGYAGFIGKALVKNITKKVAEQIVKCTVSMVTYFATGALSNVATQRFVEGKRPDELNENEAMFAGVVNAFSSLPGNFVPTAVENIYDSKFMQYLVRGSIEYLIGLFGVACGKLFSDIKV